MKGDLDAKIDSLSTVSSPENSTNWNVAKKISAPTKLEMEVFYAELSKSRNKPITLKLVPEYADSYILKSRSVSTISKLFDKQYLDLGYPELLKACHAVKIEIKKGQIKQVERDTITQAKGNSFLSTELGELGLPRARLHVRQTLPCPLSFLFSLSAIWR